MSEHTGTWVNLDPCKDQRCTPQEDDHPSSGSVGVKDWFIQP